MFERIGSIFMSNTQRVARREQDALLTTFNRLQREGSPLVDEFIKAGKAPGYEEITDPLLYRIIRKVANIFTANGYDIPADDRAYLFLRASEDGIALASPERFGKGAKLVGHVVDGVATVDGKPFTGLVRDDWDRSTNCYAFNKGKFLFKLTEGEMGDPRSGIDVCFLSKKPLEGTEHLVRLKK